MTEMVNGSSSKKGRITVLISGSGSNLQALMDSCDNNKMLGNANIVRVISDRKDAFGLKRAETATPVIPTAHHGILPYKKKYPDKPEFHEARKAYDADLAALVLGDTPSIVVCAGFMRILTPYFLHPLNNAGIPIINLHPSLHGDLVGAGCILKAWEEFQAGERLKTGVMVHYVIAEVDMGEPVVQEEVDIGGCKKLEDLEYRIHALEHRLIVEGTRRVLEEQAG